MATTVARLEAILSADTRDFDRAMGRSDSKMKGLAKTAGKAGVAGALIGLGAAIKVGVGEFMEAQRITAQTNAVLKSTGGVAGVTTKEIQGLSEALMKKSGVDDEAIQSGQNMLLTFTKIRNETGKGNDVFNQATKATLDLSVAMGKDMQSSAVLVGKALNDPIKGISALSRVGVQLTADQKATIKEMVRLGDTAGAQKVILKELETQFGGSAAAAGKTFSGQVNIAKQTMSNFAGDLVTKSIPVMQDLIRVIREDLVPAFRAIFNWVNENIVPVFRTLWGVARETWQGIARVLKDNEEPIGRILRATEALGKAWLWLAREVVLPIIKPIFTTILPVALNLTIDALDLVVRSVQKIIDAFEWIGKNAERIWGKVSGIIGKIPGLGDPFDPTMIRPPSVGAVAGVTGNDSTINAALWDELGMARAMGLSLTSGYRPGAITRSGHPSDHGTFPSKAIDVAGSSGQMAAFFRALIGNSGVKQAFYDPLGSIFGGALSGYREGGHSDHVHVATYDRGGFLRPGWNLAYNGTGGPEQVGGNITIPVSIGGEHVATVVFDMLRRKAAVFERQNGRPPFGGA